MATWTVMGSEPHHRLNKSVTKLRSKSPRHDPAALAPTLCQGYAPDRAKLFSVSGIQWRTTEEGQLNCEIFSGHNLHWSSFVKIILWNKMGKIESM